MFDLTGKVAVVTGGGSGIGRAVCLVLGRQGARVAVNYPTEELASGATETLRLLREAGSDGETCRFDVRDAEAVDAAISGIKDRLGRLDILVNNAGIARDNLLIRIKQEDLDATWSTNLNGALFCARSAIRPMMRAKTGRIINISSVVAEAGNPGQAVYAASKAGLIGLTKTLAREYASRGVTVNAVAPGFIGTDMTSRLPQEAKDRIIEQTPLGRVGAVDDVAAAVLYLASDEAAYVTGQVLRVNGGMYM